MSGLGVDEKVKIIVNKWVVSEKEHRILNIKGGPKGGHLLFASKEGPWPIAPLPLYPPLVRRGNPVPRRFLRRRLYRYVSDCEKTEETRQETVPPTIRSVSGQIWSSCCTERKMVGWNRKLKINNYLNASNVD